DKQDDLASAPWQWPLLNVGLRMCGWDDHIVKYFLLGNPFVYWASTASLPAFGLLVAYYLIRWQRGYTELSQKDIDQIHYSGIYPVIGWFLHYAPFMAMGRVTYVHHYYPALYFAILCLAFCTDWVTSRFPRALQYGVYAVLYTVVIGLFWMFRAITFGMEGSHTQWTHLKWLDSWRMTD
ncbi:dolichyl phosphate-D-mannose:protein O-D-mannosyltransferas-like protein, partial [Aureobasidium melanogenum]